LEGGDPWTFETIAVILFGPRIAIKQMHHSFRIWTGHLRLGAAIASGSRTPSLLTGPTAAGAS